MEENFLAKSVQFQRDVVPVHFNGRNSNFSIIWPVCKMLGIKFNIALYYIWQTKCLEIAIRLLPLHLENLFHGKRLISLKRLLNGRNM